MNRSGTWWCIAVVTVGAVGAAGAVVAARAPSGASAAGLAQETVCATADDPAYAFTPERPVQVGGGAMFVASRERRYMDALRGPAGETVRYKRTSSVQAPDGQTILDAYEVTHDGAAAPVTIYLDAYHFDDGMRAPKGFTCGAPIGLAPPGPDLFQASRQLLRLAAEQGSSRDFTPIPLDTTADGKPARGVVLDHFRMMARVIRAAAGSGKPLLLDPATRPPDALRQRTVVVAFPHVCEGRTIAPQTIELTSAQGQPAPRQGEYASGEALVTLLPGFEVPAGSVAATFGLQAPRANDTVRITYTEACAGAADASVQLRHTPLRALSTPEPMMPTAADAPVGAVRVQAQVDLDGALTHVTYVGGPRALLDAAIQAVRTWTVDPVRLNGAPISTPVALQVKFLPRPDK